MALGYQGDPSQLTEEQLQEIQAKIRSLAQAPPPQQGPYSVPMPAPDQVSAPPSQPNAPPPPQARPDPYGPPPEMPDLGDEPVRPAQPHYYGGSGLVYRALDGIAGARAQAAEDDYNHKMAERQTKLQRYQLARQQRQDRFEEEDRRTLAEQRKALAEKYNEAGQSAPPKDKIPSPQEVLMDPQSTPDDLKRAQRAILMMHDRDVQPSYGQPIIVDGKAYMPNMRSGKLEPTNVQGSFSKPGVDRPQGSAKVDPRIMAAAVKNNTRPQDPSDPFSNPVTDWDAVGEEISKAQGSIGSGQQQPQAAPRQPAPAAKSSVPGGAAIARAPKGMPDGPNTYKGKPVVIRGGVVYPN